jgi:uncharacterized membrane protein
MEPDERTFSEKVSDAIARFGGSWHFILSGMSLIILWVVVNLTSLIKFDPYPFILLNLFLSLVAAFQAPFILMSQKRVEEKQDFIYRSLFKEIKELVETDLSIENEVHENQKELMEMIKEIQKKLDEKN